MVIYIPHFGTVRDETLELAEKAIDPSTGEAFQIVPHSVGKTGPDDIYSHLDDYFCFLRDQWEVSRYQSHGEPLLILGPDMLPWPGALEELVNCSSDWCGFGYPDLDAIWWGLGCAKFSHALMHDFPDAVLDVAKEPSTPLHPSCHWCTLDENLQRSLRRYGLEMHRHGPPIGRLHGTVNRHGCRALYQTRPIPE